MGNLIFSLRDEYTTKYINTAQETFQSLADNVSNWFSSLIGIANKTGIERIQTIIFNSLTVYKNDVLHEKVIKETFNKWYNSDFTIEKLLKEYGIGESAERTCRNVENTVESNAIDTIRKTEIPDIIPAESNLKEEHFLEIYSCIKDYINKIHEIQEDTEVKLNQLSEENKIFYSLTFLLQQAIVNTSDYIDQLVKDIQNIEEDVINNTVIIEENSDRESTETSIRIENTCNEILKTLTEIKEHAEKRTGNSVVSTASKEKSKLKQHLEDAGYRLLDATVDRAEEAIKDFGKGSEEGKAVDKLKDIVGAVSDATGLSGVMKSGSEFIDAGTDILKGINSKNVAEKLGNYLKAESKPIKNSVTTALPVMNKLLESSALNNSLTANNKELTELIKQASKNVNQINQQLSKTESSIDKNILTAILDVLHRINYMSYIIDDENKRNSNAVTKLVNNQELLEILNQNVELKNIITKISKMNKGTVEVVTQYYEILILNKFNEYAEDAVFERLLKYQQVVGENKNIILLSAIDAYIESNYFTYDLNNISNQQLFNIWYTIGKMISTVVNIDERDTEQFLKWVAQYIGAEYTQEKISLQQYM